MPELLYLTYLVVILVIGLVSYLFAKLTKFPVVLFLISSGIILTYGASALGLNSLVFPQDFMNTMSILVLILLVFDSTSKFSIDEVDKLSPKTILFVILFTFLNLGILSWIIYFIFPVSSYMVALLFASLLSGTGADIVLSLMQRSANKLVEILQLESILNTPLTVIIPFFILEIITVSQSSSALFGGLVVTFLQKVISGIGAGIVVGIIVFKIMRKVYSEQLSPLALIVAALLSYILAENINGNGVFAVTALGLVFGAVYVKGKVHLLEFSSLTAILFQMIVFVVAGTLINLNHSSSFWAITLCIFLITILLRFVSVHIIYGKEFSSKQKIFMTFISPKGIATTVMIFSLFPYVGKIDGLSNVLEATLLIVVLSIISSACVARYENWFLVETKTKNKHKAHQ